MTSSQSLLTRSPGAPLAGDARVVFVVDDDDLVRAAIGSLLRSVDLEVRAFATTEEFQAAPRAPGPSCLVLDVRLRGQSGLAFQQALREAGRPHMPIIFMTGYPDREVMERAERLHPAAILLKPTYFPALLDAIEKVFSS